MSTYLDKGQLWRNEVVATWTNRTKLLLALSAASSFDPVFGQSCLVVSLPSDCSLTSGPFDPLSVCFSCGSRVRCHCVHLSFGSTFPNDEMLAAEN